MVPQRYLIPTLPISSDDRFRLSVSFAANQVGIRYHWGRFFAHTYLSTSPFYKGFPGDWGTSTPKSRFFLHRTVFRRVQKQKFLFLFCSFPTSLYLCKCYLPMRAGRRAEVCGAGGWSTTYWKALLTLCFWFSKLPQSINGQKHRRGNSTGCSIYSP